MLRELELEALQRFIIRLDLTSKPAFTMAYMVLGFHRFFHAFSTLCAGLTNTHVGRRFINLPIRNRDPMTIQDPFLRNCFKIYDSGSVIQEPWSKVRDPTSVVQEPGFMIPIEHFRKGSDDRQSGERETKNKSQ